MKTSRTEHKLIIVLLTLALSAFLTNQSIAGMIKRDLAYAFQNTEAVVDATVLKIEQFEYTVSLMYREQSGWSSSLVQKACGTKVKLRINKVYSGSYDGEIDIGVDGALVTGRRYLLFLDERLKFVTSDVITTGHGQNEEDQCVSELPLLKSNWHYTSNISGLGQKFLVLSRLLREPDELQEFTDVIESKWFVSGEPLDYEAFNNLGNPTAEEVDKFFQIERKVSPICNKLNFKNLCGRHTILPFKRVDEWLDRQSKPKANKSLNTETGDAGAG